MNSFSRCGAVLILAALCGLPSFGQPTADAPPTPTSAKRGFIKLMVPSDAKVEIDGVATKQTGPTRLFATPELTPAKDGKQYFYRLKVTTMVDGKPSVVEKDVYIELGREVTIDVTKTEPKKEEPKKEEPKKDMKKEEPKKEEPKKEEPKKEEPKKEEPKKPEVPKKEMKKEEPKKPEEPKKEEPKKEEPKKPEEPKKEEPKKPEEPKKQMKKEEPKKPEEKKPDVTPPTEPKKLEEPKPVTPKVVPVLPPDPKEPGLDGERLTVPPRIVKD